ncbi:MAG: prephenate dehydratase, partial [Prevotella sp.]|nr:prephenate dehydratase [Prevotella sp.]
MKRIAIQGELGSFHDIAARQYYDGEQIQMICCSTFEEVFENIKRDPTVIGMLAIENTIAGSLLHNYELLRASGVTIVGEHKLHIEHCICCLPEDDWSTIQEVHSHPVALMQCRGWAAICNSSAAKMYGLKVLEDQIEDNKHNFTRFLVVSSPRKADFLRPLDKTDKSSLVFLVPHEEGSL